ncbi:MAG: LysR family transcriptional regulator [Sandaracinaceae bacterium]
MADALNFNHVYYFHVVAAEGSIRAASKKLGLTQPTVSEQIRRLEQSLGTQLFERIAGGLRLTQAGREAYEYTQQMFLASQRMVETLGKSSGPAPITLRVGVSAGVSRSMAAHFVVPVLTLEECRPSLRTGELAELGRDLRSHDLDLVIAESPLEDADSNLESTLIARPRLVAVLRPGVEPAPDWSNLSIIEHRSSSVFHWEVDAFLKERELHPRSAGETDDASIMLEAAVRGGFVAFVPRSMAHDSIQAGRVRGIATLKIEEGGVFASYPTGEAHELARTAIDGLVAAAREYGGAFEEE